MPLTHAASRRSFANDGIQPSTHQQVEHAGKAPAKEVIIISDTEEEAHVEAVGRTSKKRTIPPAARATSRKRVYTSKASELSDIEIVTEREDLVPIEQWKERAQAAEHARIVSEKAATERVQRYKSAEASAKAELDVLRDELKELCNTESQVAARADKAVKELAKASALGSGGGVNMEALEWSVSCRICQEKMWRPWMLSDCGHVYCQDCLSDWFSTVLTKHIETHPGYTVNFAPPITPAQLARLPVQIQPFLAYEANALPRSPYSCPNCRVGVTCRPTEVFVIKSIVEWIAERTGEKNPYSLLQTAAPARDSGPWDGFFGSA